MSSLKIIGAAAIALLATAGTYANAAENSSRITQEQHACAIVLGLDPSGRQYDTCIRTLDRSLAERDQAQLIQTARSACAQKGLQPDPTAFAVRANRRRIPLSADGSRPFVHVQFSSDKRTGYTPQIGGIKCHASS